LENAQRLLAVAMGLNGEDILYAPLAADSFPELVAPAGFDRDKLKTYIAEAFNRRNDRLSSLLSEDANLILVDQARRNLAPRADLFVKGFVSGQSEGAQAENWVDYYSGGMVGTGMEVGFSMDWPFANNSAKGTLAQRQATLRIQQVQSRMTEQSIISGICNAEFLVHSSARLYATQKSSMEEFGKALDAERQKFQLGEGTSINVLQTEESLTVAGLSMIDARLRNAVAVARLRHGTGTMLPALKADVAMPVERYRLTTPPVF
jgi:outer membrane protein TolC